MSPTKRTPNKESVPRSVRVTLECDGLWDALAEKFGISKTGIVELAIRQMAKAEGVVVQTAPDKKVT
jgi:hypothetical protein